MAPASEVARAVGALLIDAATAELGAAGPPAATGCADGVARMVDVALARLVLHAVSAGEALPRPDDAAPPLLPLREPPRASLPASAWWPREPSWAPRLVGAPAEPLAMLWPTVPEPPGRPGPSRPAVRPAAPEETVLPVAWRVLERELVPSDRRGGWEP